MYNSALGLHTDNISSPSKRGKHRSHASHVQLVAPFFVFTHTHLKSIILFNSSLSETRTIIDSMNRFSLHFLVCKAQSSPLQTSLARVQVCL